MVDVGIIVGIVIGVFILALIIAVPTILILYFCIYREKRKKYKKNGHATKGHINMSMNGTMNGAPIIYANPHQSGVEMFSSTDNVFEVPPTTMKKASSVYSLPNGSTYGGGGSVIVQPAYRGSSSSHGYDNTDQVFLTMPAGGYHPQHAHHKRKPTKAKRLLSDEIWRSRTKSLVKRDRTRSVDQLDSRPVQVHYPASTIGYESSTLQYQAPNRSRSATMRSRAASEYGGSHYGGSHYGGVGGGGVHHGGSHYGSTPSLLRVHKAVPMKTKNKKTVYVIDNSTVASESIVMAPSGRVSPPPLSPTRSLTLQSAGRPATRSYVTRNHANTSFDLIDHTNTHLFDSEATSRGGGAAANGVAFAHSGSHSPRRDDTLKQFRDPSDLRLVWTEDMRQKLEDNDTRRHGSDASSMASLPRRRQQAPGEHLFHYDSTKQKLTPF